MGSSDESTRRQRREVPLVNPTVEGGSSSIHVDIDAFSMTIRSEAGIEPASPSTRRIREPLEAPSPELERFDDRGEIARGGMGAVHLVFDRRLERHEAMKLLAADAEGAMSIEQAERARARFLDEARVTGQLDHPNIVPIYDMGLRADGTPAFITMKMIQGDTFSAWLERLGERRFTSPELERVVGAVVKICDALAFAHGRGVIHCDLKPANVMIGSHGQVFVMDWGLAMVMPGSSVRRRGRPAEPGAILGTPAYMAPEQARGKIAAIDARTDIYGLGGMLYRVLTDRPPHVASTLLETLRLAREGVVQPPEEVTQRRLPAELCRICLKALAPAPEDRYASMDELRGDLEGFLRGGAWMPTRFVPAGSFIVREGEPGDAAYVIVDGMCAVTKVVDAQTVTLRVLGPGDVFGETAVITAGPRSATVVARTDVTLKVVTAETLDLELSRNAWLRRFVEALAQRFRDHDVELSELRARAR
jgi:hypothetical protein